MGEEWTDRQSPEALASWRRSEKDTVEVVVVLPLALARDLFSALGTALHMADSSEPPTFDVEGEPDAPPDERLPDR